MATILIDKYMEELDYIKTYSSTAFEEWYCNENEPDYFLINDSSMRRWLSNFNDYIEARRVGRNWELDYRSIFRLRMLLIYRKFGYKPTKLQELLGLKVTAQLVDEDEHVSSPIENVHPTDESLRFLASVGMQMIQSGFIVVDPEKGPLLKIPALPGDLDHRLEQLDSDMKSNQIQIENLTSALNEQQKLTAAQQETIENQQRLTDKQQRTIEAVSSIHEMILAYQNHGDPEKLQQELHELRRRDPESYIDTMMSLVKAGRKEKKGRGFLGRIFKWNSD